MSIFSKRQEDAADHELNQLQGRLNELTGVLGLRPEDYGTDTSPQNFKAIKARINQLKKLAWNGNRQQGDDKSLPSRKSNPPFIFSN
jgi:hypothetical protein